MKRYTLMAQAAAAGFVIATASTAPAQSPAGDQTQTQRRNEYQQRMRELKTQEEREQFRKEHHA